MSDLYAYRASDELASALRAYIDELRPFEDQVAAWDAAHPPLLWKNDGFAADKRPVGFKDVDPKEPPPKGLSRAQTRVELIPVRGKAGNEWRDTLERFNARPKVEPVWDRFGVPSHVWVAGPGFSSRIMAVQFGDCGDDGVIVFCAADVARPRREMEPDAPPQLPEHLTPIPLSEFYAIKERLNAEQAGAR